jgi:glycosyltransferase involved in cell wall biosynthesis
MRNYSLKSARKNIVIGDIMNQRLRDYGVDEAKIRVIHNWSIEDNIQPLKAANNPLRKKWCLQNKFIIGYSGNIGRAHDISTLIDIASSLKNAPDIVFVIIGGGALYEKFKDQVEKRCLQNVMFQPYQPKDVLPQSLTLPDLHVISLQPDLEGLIVPSKFYGIIASGRPVLYIGDSEGEIPKILSANDCGQSTNIGDVSSAVKFIELLVSEPERTAEIGRHSRHLFDEKFKKQFSFELWVEVFSSLNVSRTHSGEKA